MVGGHGLIKAALVVRRWLWEGFVNGGGRRSCTPVIYWKDQHPVLSSGDIGDVSFPTEKLDALVMKELVDDERDALRTSEHAIRTEFHLNPDIQLDEPLNPVQVPGLDVDVVDRGGEDEDAIQLPHPVSWEVDPYAVEEGMLQSLLRGVYADMENGSCGREGGRGGGREGEGEGGRERGREGGKGRRKEET